MKAKDRFDNAMARCDRLIELYHKENNKDLLRSAVVFAVAALDKYCKDKFLDHFEEFYRRMLLAPEKRECCDAYLDKAGLSSKERLSLYQEKAVDCSFNPELAMAKQLRKYLYRSTFQRMAAITELFECYCLKEIIERAVDKAQDNSVKVSVERLIRRRHQIAHTSDCGEGDEVQDIAEDTVVEWLEALKELVECIDNIVNTRFNVVATGDLRRTDLIANRPAEAFDATYHKNHGYLDAREQSCLRRIADIEEYFGVKAKRKGFLFAGVVDYPVMDNSEIWWPKIAAEPNYAGWKNEPCYDANNEIVEIVERNTSSQELNDKVIHDNCEKNRLRIVLGVVEGDTCVVGYCYRFLGTFTLDIEASKERKACVWKRKDARMDLKRFQEKGV